LTLGLLAAPATASSAPADPVTTLLGSLLGESSSSDGSQPAARQRSSYGRTSAPDGTLRSGCHNYRYGYRLRPPTSDWTLETFLRDRTGEGIASGVFISDSDPRAQHSHFRFCRYSTRAGRFTIRALMHWYGPTGAEHQVWLEPSHFRLSRPS
ncbi:hypothetical protein ACFP8W_19250, partial [Nocardioides hankookensis]